MEDHEVDTQFQELVKGMPELTDVTVSLGDIAKAAARLQESAMWLSEFVQETLNGEIAPEFPDDLLTVLAQILPLSFEVTETLSGIINCDCDDCEGNESCEDS